MPSITFIDTEIEPNSGKIFDIGSVNESGSLFHSNSIADFIKFLQGSQYICGHNIFNHDLKYLEKVINDTGINKSNFIDTLFLPPLLFPAKPYHGKMDKQEKSENQDVFIKGDVQIMVATSAFGMGVDKKDIGMVIHYDISDSLEIYVQEAGRAGRDENISADCFVLFNDEDLNKHFILLNQTKINIREIQQIWKAIKNITKFRQKASRSALEIARQAGWDDSIDEIETRVKTAIAALEEAGYIKRGQNMPRVYANSILAKML